MPSSKLIFEICLLLLLFFVNAIHAQIILVQGRWYREFDTKLAASVGVRRPVIKKAIGSTWLWCLLHWLIAFAALIAAAYLGYLKSAI